MGHNPKLGSIRKPSFRDHTRTVAWGAVKDFGDVILYSIRVRHGINENPIQIHCHLLEDAVGKVDDWKQIFCLPNGISICFRDAVIQLKVRSVQIDKRIVGGNRKFARRDLIRVGGQFDPAHFPHRHVRLRNTKQLYFIAEHFFRSFSTCDFHVTVVFSCFEWGGGGGENAVTILYLTEPSCGAK